MAILLLLGACARHVETRVTSTGVQGARQTGFMLDAAHSPKDAASIAAQKSVVDRLRAAGFELREKESPLLLHVGLSVRPANLSVVWANGDRASTRIGTADPKKRARKKCQQNEYRLAIELVSLADGNSVYTGSAAEFHCALSVEDALPALVDAAVADFGKPRGEYVTFRRARH